MEREGGVQEGREGGGEGVKVGAVFGKFGAGRRGR